MVSLLSAGGNIPSSIKVSKRLAAPGLLRYMLSQWHWSVLHICVSLAARLDNTHLHAVQGHSPSDAECAAKVHSKRGQGHCSGDCWVEYMLADTHMHLPVSHTSSCVALSIVTRQSLLRHSEVSWIGATISSLNAFCPLSSDYCGKIIVCAVQAGVPGSITIATNMAGRGTDIILGGNPKGLAHMALQDTILPSMLSGEACYPLIATP